MSARPRCGFSGWRFDGELPVGIVSHVDRVLHARHGISDHNAFRGRAAGCGIARFFAPCTAGRIAVQLGATGLIDGVAVGEGLVSGCHAGARVRFTGDYFALKETSKTAWEIPSWSLRERRSAENQKHDKT